MNYIGIDLATNAGVVVLRNSRSGFTTEFAECLKMRDSKDMVASYKLMESAIDRIEPYLEDAVMCIEDVFVGSFARTIVPLADMRGAFRTMIMPRLGEKSYFYYATVSTLRSFLSDGVKIKKKDVPSYVSSRWGFDNEDDNINDAYVCAMHAAKLGKA